MVFHLRYHKVRLPLQKFYLNWAGAITQVPLVSSVHQILWNEQFLPLLNFDILDRTPIVEWRLQMRALYIRVDCCNWKWEQALCLICHIQLTNDKMLKSNPFPNLASRSSCCIVHMCTRISWLTKKPWQKKSKKPLWPRSW